MRPWQPADTPVLAHHANDAGIAENLRDVFPHPYSPADAEWYIGFVSEPDSPDLHLAIEVDGEACGSISVLFQADVYRRSAEIGYWLGRQQWGRGIATAAVQALCSYAFAHFDLVRIYAGVFASNPASKAVLTKAGFELEGRLRNSVTKGGRTMDSLLYARLKG
nr:GNAT family protein [Hymenobacter translucens]